LKEIDYTLLQLTLIWQIYKEEQKQKKTTQFITHFYYYIYIAARATTCYYWATEAQTATDARWVHDLREPHRVALSFGTQYHSRGRSWAWLSANN